MACGTCGNDNLDEQGVCQTCGPERGGLLNKASIALGAQTPLPPGVAGWCWGGLLLNWIWAIRHRVWIGLLGLVPYCGVGVAVFLGLKGRELAWKKGHWESVEQFNRVQRSWTRWGIAFWVALIVLSVLVPILISAIVGPYARRT